MLLRMVGSIMIICGCSAMGFSLSNDYTLRIRQLEQMNRVLLLLEGEIRYHNSGISEALLKISKMSNGIFSTFFINVVKTMRKGKSLKEAWCTSVTGVLEKNTKLKDSDMGILKELGNCLGVTDRETQINNIEKSRVQIDNIMGELNKIKIEKCKIYKTLGVVAGMFIAIILL